MTEAQIKSVALFFYFTLLDENLVEKASRLAIERSHKILKKEDVTTPPAVVIFHQCYKVFEKARKENLLNKAVLRTKTNFITPAGISLGAWRQFHKEASPEDLISVVFSRILNVEEDIIALSMGVSKGSVRYRVGRGLRQLGHLITLGEIIA